MNIQEALKIYRHALRDYQVIASDFKEHNNFSLKEMMKYFQENGTDHKSVFTIEYGIIKTAIIPYHSDCLYHSKYKDYSLSQHIFIYIWQDDERIEFDSLSVTRLKMKIRYLKMRLSRE